MHNDSFNLCDFFFFLRFSDFMVNEIDNFRNIVHLTNFNIPKVESPADKPDVQVVWIPKEVSVYSIYI